LSGAAADVVLDIDAARTHWVGDGVRHLGGRTATLVRRKGLGQPAHVALTLSWWQDDAVARPSLDATDAADPQPGLPMPAAGDKRGTIPADSAAATASPHRDRSLAA
ncbi:MAG: hypothetical protein AAF772_06290, partial [Acidobacteriota bacterium]